MGGGGTGIPIVDDAIEVVDDAVDWVGERLEDTYEWVDTQVDYLSGEAGDKANDLEDRSKALEAEINAFQDYAETVSSRYIKESYLYRDNADFKFVVTNADLKYLKYIYPEKAEEYQTKIDQLNQAIKDYEDKYGGGFLGTKDWLGDWAGDIITGIAMAIGNVVGFLTGKDVSFEDALKSAIALVALYFTIMYVPQMAPELFSTLGLVIPSMTVYVVTTVLLVTIALDSTFGGSKGMIEVLNIFGDLFESLGLTKGTNVFNKFFDSFRKESDYNGYLIMATNMLVAIALMPNFETMMGANYAKIYQGYSALNNVKGIIDARDEYEKEKEEYEKKLADMQKKAIDTERNARLSKLSNSMIEGDDIVKGTWWNQYAGMQGWMTFDRPNGLFFGTKDSPDDIMFKYDLYAITHPNIRNLGVMPERLT